MIMQTAIQSNASAIDTSELLLRTNDIFNVRPSCDERSGPDIRVSNLSVIREPAWQLGLFDGELPDD
jgi:hypothetical protein